MHDVLVDHHTALVNSFIFFFKRKILSWQWHHVPNKPKIYGHHYVGQLPRFHVPF